MRVRRGWARCLMAGVPARVKMLFSAWCLEPLFDEFRIDRERWPLGERAKQAARFATLVGNEAALATKSKSLQVAE